MQTDGLLIFDDISPNGLDAYADIFEADVDTTGIGEVYYRVTNDSSVILKANDIVNNATWDNFGYYNSNTDKVRTIYLHDIVS